MLRQQKREESFYCFAVPPSHPLPEAEAVPDDGRHEGHLSSGARHLPFGDHVSRGRVRILPRLSPAAVRSKHNRRKKGGEGGEKTQGEPRTSLRPPTHRSRRDQTAALWPYFVPLFTRSWDHAGLRANQKDSETIAENATIY